MSESIDDGHDNRASSPPPFEDGTTTQNLKKRARRLRTPVTAEEQHLRTRGTWLIATGLVIVALTLGIAVVWRAGFGGPMPYEIVIAMYAVGFALASLGGTERMARSTRRAHALELMKIDENHDRLLSELARVENGLFMLVNLMGEQLRQTWFAGYGTAGRDMHATGTDNSRSVATAEVVQLQRRNDRGRG